MRFRKSIKIAPGLKLNLSKSGISSTFGGKGLSVNIGGKGAYLNTGIPGTGISNRTKIIGGEIKDKSGDSDIEKAEWIDTDKLIKSLNETANEFEAIRENTNDFEYKEFKNKIKLAKGKVSFASNLSYLELYQIIPKDDTIIMATQYCGKFSMGAIVLTKYLFYATCKQDDQLIVLPLDEIKAVSPMGGFFKTNILIKTDKDDYTIKSVVRLKETIDILTKIIQK
jgi:hypothetical protein